MLLPALDDFDRCFESFFGDSPFTPAERIFNHLPAADIRETEKAYVLDMELPGYDEKGIEISVDGSNLSVVSRQEETKESSSQPEGEKKEERETWLLRERKVRSFNRSFKLPENANPEEVTAEFKNGILSIEIQKRPEAQKKTIHIKAG
jgi:HSP20 family protein